MQGYAMRVWIARGTCANVRPGRAATVTQEHVLRLHWPWWDVDRRFSFLKAVTFGLMFLPAIWFVDQVETGGFGIYPLSLAGMTFWSGVLATGILLLALAITPAVTVLRWSRLMMVRRMIGITALVYTAGHILVYFALRLWNFAFIWNEMTTRLTLVIATIATVGLVALGVTSADAAVRRMGARGWQRLHNTIYLLTALALVHFLLSPDAYPEQYLMCGVFFWLLMWRLLNRRKLGTDPRALAILALASGVFTALLEAGWIWAYHEYEPIGTLAQNFNLDLGVSPAFKVFGLGILFALAALARPAPRRGVAGVVAGKIG
jgi:sulfoxide reductase heme-binding subunit YedZ